MSNHRIIEAEGVAVLPLSQEVLEALGMEVGDEVDVSIANGSIVLRPVEAEGRSETFGEIIETLFQERQKVYLELAGGAE